MRIHAHIRSNIASRHSEGDLGFRISISAATPESFQACECKIKTKNTRIEGKIRLIPAPHEAHEE